MKTLLRSISLKGFRSFSDPATISLPESGLVLIKGNISGAGKSTILLASSYALGYCPFSGTDLQSWHGDEDLEVVLQLENGVGPATLTKGTKKASFVVGDEKITGASAVQAKVQKFVGLDSSLLSALTYRPQKTPGLFLSKTNSEMQEFLTTLLGLEKYETVISVCQNNIKKLEVDLEHAQREVERQETLIKAAEAQVFPEIVDVSELEASVKEWEKLALGCRQASEQAAVRTLEAYNARKAEEEGIKNAGNAKLKELRNCPPGEITSNDRLKELEKVYSEVSSRLFKLKEAERVRLYGIQSAISETERNITQARIELQGESGLKSNLSGLLAEQEKIFSQVCPYCQQTWLQGENTDKKLQAIAAKVREITERLDKLPALKEKVERDLVTLADLRNLLEPHPNVEKFESIKSSCAADISAEQARLKGNNDLARSSWEKKIALVSAETANKINECHSLHRANIEALEAVSRATQQEHTATLQKTLKARADLETAKVRNEYAQREITSFLAAKKRTQELLNQSKMEREYIQTQMNMEQELVLIFKQFLTAIFDEVLEQIAWNTNQMLAFVPNVAHVTIKFKSESVTAKGTIKRAIVPVLLIDGMERPLKSALSGGMMTAVELAVDLAVRKVISARAGSTPGWLILDECFEGLGVNEKEACLTLLRQASSDTLILVVDHSNEFKEMFTTTVEVEYVNGRSRIVS